MNNLFLAIKLLSFLSLLQFFLYPMRYKALIIISIAGFLKPEMTNNRYSYFFLVKSRTTFSNQKFENNDFSCEARSQYLIAPDKNLFSTQKQMFLLQELKFIEFKPLFTIISGSYLCMAQIFFNIYISTCIYCMSRKQ